MVNYSHLLTRKKILENVLLIVALVAMSGMGFAQATQAGAAAKAMAKKAAKPSTPKPAEKQPASRSAVQPVEGNLRDPFKLPAQSTEAPAGNGEMAILGPLPPGPRGLIIDQLKLEGIVRQGGSNPTTIAVLANSANRAYFLHENDSLYNGVITKITPDSVYFREDTHDAAGKTTSREVVKKLAPAPGEKK